MDTLTIQATPKTPFISADPIDNKIIIKGRSIPSNPIEFYQPLTDWLYVYSNKCEQGTISADVNIEYINTSSSKCLLTIFKRLDMMSKKGWKVEINWFYNEDDDEIYTAGADYQALISCPMELIEVF